MTPFETSVLLVIASGAAGYLAHSVVTSVRNNRPGRVTSHFRVPLDITGYELGDYDEIDPPYCRSYAITVHFGEGVSIDGTVSCTDQGGDNWQPIWNTWTPE